MHAVIRKYTDSPDVSTEARPKLQHLEQTMRRHAGLRRLLLPGDR